jgi:hypothetical protein
MKTTLKSYLLNIKPTGRGTNILLLMILGVPLLIDFTMLFVDDKMVDKFSLTLFTAKGFMIIFICLFIYHLINFILIKIKQQLKNS